MPKYNASSEDILNASAVYLPLDNAIFRETENYDEKNLPDLATPYLPPYFNPSRYPIVFQNTTNSTTFEVLFHFTPTLSNLLILVGLASCTIWVIVMNLMIIGALLKGHKKDKEHVTDMYLINLLFADVLLGVFVFPFMSIVILIGYFPLSAAWCNLWVYFDYYLIIASSYGFAALMTSYLLILRWPQYYPSSRKLHLLFIVIVWIFSNAPWTAPFINDRVFVLYPHGVCGFSIQKNRYFTLYIGITGFYLPLAMALLAGIFAVKYLKQSVRASFFKLLLNADGCHVHPLMPSSPSDYAEFNDLYRVRGGNIRCQVKSAYLKPPSAFSPHEIPSESTERSDSTIYNKRPSIMSVSTFHRTRALQDSVKRHFPLVATSLILFVLSRSFFYTYFGIGSIIPRLFPPDLSHSVYWIMHSYAILAPIVHIILDADLRRSVTRFVTYGTFDLDDFPITPTKAVLSKVGNDHVLPKVSIIEAPNSNHHHHDHHHHRHHHRHLEKAERENDKSRMFDGRNANVHTSFV